MPRLQVELCTHLVYAHLKTIIKTIHRLLVSSYLPQIYVL